MKDKIKTFEEFETRMKNQTVPAVSLNQKTMAYKKVYKPIYLRTSFIAIFLSIFVTASIATAMNYTGWKLFNDEGKQLFEIKTMREEEEVFHKGVDYTYNRNENIIDSIKQTIPDGEFKYFLEVKGYEDVGSTSVLYLMNANEVKSVTQIPKEISESFLLKDVIHDKFILTEGTVSYDPLPRDHDVAKREAMNKELYEEAKEKNLPYITKDGTLTSEISYVNLGYNNKHPESYQRVTIDISPVGKEMITNENFEGFTKVKIDGRDILYSEEGQRVLFIKEEKSKKFLVSIRGSVTGFNFEEWDSSEEATKAFASIESINKDELINIAKSILK